MHVYTEFIGIGMHTNTNVYIWIFWPLKKIYDTYEHVYDILTYMYLLDTHRLIISTYSHTYVFLCVNTHIKVNGSEPVNLYPLQQRVPEMTQD